jgi:hypothetical protein
MDTTASAEAGEGSSPIRPRVPGPQSPKGNAASVDPQYARTLNVAENSFIKVIKKIETQNSKLLFRQQFPETEVSVVAVSAPNLEQISDVSDALSGVINGAAPEMQDKLRYDLQRAYNDAVKYTTAFKVFYLLRRGGSETPSLTMTELDNLSGVSPSTDGSIRIEGKTTRMFSREGVWKGRYDHIFVGAPRE